MSAEPSMEDILSSIKRIIAEEGEAGPAPRPKRAARAIAPDDHRPDAPADEVLELSDPVEDTATAPAGGAPARSADTTATGAAPGSGTNGTAPVEKIMSDQAAQASRGQLEALSRLIVKPDVPGSDTLEGLVRDMLRPMLREWLDANLPTVVERLVTREIERISNLPR